MVLRKRVLCLTRVKPGVLHDNENVRLNQARIIHATGKGLWIRQIV